jgi:class 3 adenylate cyclase/tetratricopeptide (TPR) repeat protein
MLQQPNDMSKMDKWLDDRGLGKYKGVFADNEIELDDLQYLTEQDLRELGLPMGPRRRLLGQIAPTAPKEGSAQETGRQFEPKQSPSVSPERRQLTVMFCDLVDSVALGEQLELEDYRDLLTTFRESISEVVENIGGFIARHLGDGLLVYFGYPIAREDDAVRAVRAGLAIVDKVRTLLGPNDVAVKVRVGIATGLAVVGDRLNTSDKNSSELGALGPTPNLAARIQGAAPPNTVLVSAVTREMVLGHFEILTLPPRELKGISGETELYVVSEEQHRASRFEARASARQGPFVGRQEELGLLLRRWEVVLAGNGQVALITGEPGIGKSRLLTEFRTHSLSSDFEQLSFQCSAHLTHSALHPIKAALENSIGLNEDLDAQTATSRIDAWSQEQSLPVGETTIRIGEILSRDLGYGSETETAEDPHHLRERQLLWLTDFIVHRAGVIPVVCLFEDIHWADPSTKEFLERVVEVIEPHRVFVICTSRQNAQIPWSDRSNVRIINLPRLDDAEGSAIALAVLQAPTGVQDKLLHRVVARAGGNPLFIEELSRVVLQSPSSEDDESTIPATLHDSLMARLDALALGKAVAQWASVIGREFEGGVLEYAWEQADDKLSEGLLELEHTGLVQRRGEASRAIYRFKHALVRDAAYDSMLRSVRRQIHGKVLAALTELRPQTETETFAHHATEAEAWEAAVNYWLEAGKQAVARSANQEAIEHFRRGIALTRRPEIDMPQQALALWSALGPLLMVAEGDASESAERAFGTALEIAQQLESPPDVQYPLAWGQWYMHLMRGNRSQVESLANRLRQMSQQSGRTDLVIETHHSEWTFNMHYGKLNEVRDSAAAAIELYEPEIHSDLRFQFANHDPRMCAYFHTALADSVCGQTSHSRVAAEQSLAWAEELQHMPSIAIARLIPLITAYWEGDTARIETDVEAFKDACAAIGADWYGAIGEIFEGWAASKLRRDLTAHRKVGQALEMVRATGQVTRMPMYYTVLAETLYANGFLEDALEMAKEAVTSCQVTGQIIYEPQAWNVLGLIQLGLSDTSMDADFSRLSEPFARGVRSARTMEMPLLGLHPATSFLRLYQECRNGGNAADHTELFLEEVDQASGAPIVNEARFLISQ